MWIYVIFFIAVLVFLKAYLLSKLHLKLFLMFCKINDSDKIFRFRKTKYTSSKLQYHVTCKLIWKCARVTARKMRQGIKHETLHH